MLSVAGVSAYAWSWKIAIAVAVVMLTVVASYRQNVHAYPSGGGDYEVATVNLGPTAGVTVASALLVDYVLTVAVSISSGIQNAASAIGVRLRARGVLGQHPGAGARGAQPARRPGVGHVLRRPDLRLHARHHGDGALRALPAADRRRCPTSRAPTCT